MKLFCRRQVEESDFCSFFLSPKEQIACTLIESTIEWININSFFYEKKNFLLRCSISLRFTMERNLLLVTLIMCTEWEERERRKREIMIYYEYTISNQSSCLPIIDNTNMAESLIIFHRIQPSSNVSFYL